MSAASAQHAVSFLEEDKSLACIHCGLCLSSCPTYLETGNENDSPRGRIYLMRALADGRLPLTDPTVRHIDLCLGCRACEAACPSGVQYGALLEQTRDHVEHHFRRAPFQTFLRRFAIEKILPFPRRLRLALLPARGLKFLEKQKTFGSGKLLPRVIREALALIPEHDPCPQLPELSPALFESKQGRIGFLSGCVMSVMFSRTNHNTVKLLNRAGQDVLTPATQVCCGALYAHSGQLEKARDCARKNIVAFDNLQLDAIITNAAGCGSTLKEYGHLLHADPVWKDRALAFSAKVRDLTEWLAEARLSTTEPGGESSRERKTAPTQVTFHDACHLAHAQRITKAPRELVRGLAQSAFVELPESDVCCGSAGSYNLTEPEMAARLQQRKIENILKSGAQIVVTTNPGCILQIRAGLQKAGAGHVQVVHLADYLESRPEPNSPSR
jgi:glycolate dehydrogenase iron-sulfur subunit